jgi:hypothetical protein
LSYAKQAWTDNTMLVDAVHLNHMEDGIGTADANASQALANVAGAEVQANKGQVNGYAALGTDGKVPAAQLPAVAVQTVGYGTSLPASPTDGQEYVLVDNAANPSFQWRFRYNAGSTFSAKWEFVGGTSTFNRVETREGILEQLPFGDCATVGPSLPFPRAGQYMIEWGCGMDYTGVITTSYMGVQVGGTAVSSAQAAFSAVPVGQFGSCLSGPYVYNVNAGDVVTAKYATGNQGGSGYYTYFQRRWLKVTPRRVS